MRAIHVRSPSRRHAVRAVRHAMLAGATLAAACALPGVPEPSSAPHAPAGSAAAPTTVPAAVPAATSTTTPAARPPAAPTRIAADPQAVADAMRGASVVLLGEVHDNAAQHALRAQALARRVAGGARPALAFEQLDRERQADVDRARRERPRDADHLIAQAGGGGWDWPLYRPFVALALEHDLPIVAANLSRADASRIVRGGLEAVFDAQARATLGLDAPPADLLAAHSREVDAGHCGLMPQAMLAPMARAQLARDAVLAAAIAPHASRGVVLLTGNGHARADIGVPRWLPAPLRAGTRAIGLLESAAPDAMPAGAFDHVVVTAAAPRDDPCASLRGRSSPASGRVGGTGAAPGAGGPQAR